MYTDLASEIVIPKTPKNTDLSSRIRTIVPKVATISKSEDLRRIAMLVEQLEAVLAPEALTDTEKAKLTKELKKVLRTRYIRVFFNVLTSRCNNYKNGIKQQGRQVKMAAVLRVHYGDQVNKLVTGLVEKMKDGSSVMCVGCSKQETPITSMCESCVVLDPRDINMEQFSLDHWYEQEKVNAEMKRYIEHLGNNPKDFPAVQEFIEKHGAQMLHGFASYVSQYYEEPAESELQKEIGIMLTKVINMDQYRDDLFGSNVYLRCKTCDKISKPAKFHPDVPKGRYCKE